MESLEKVWRTYGRTKDPALKEQLILEYAPMVKFVAGRLMMHVGQHVEYDDLISYGIFGLIDAIEKYNIDKGVKFETYASVRVRGAIIDNIRKIDWVPRTMRQKNKEYERICIKLEAELGREPTAAEVAEKLNITVEQARELMRKSTVLSLVSLDDYLEQNYEAGLSTGSPDDMPEEHYSRQELHSILTDTIEKLSEKEKTVVTLYYYEDLTLKEISGIMGVSESRVSQIHSKAILRMQGRLGKYKSVLFS